jgi:hypothetical protein
MSSRLRRAVFARGPARKGSAQEAKLFYTEHVLMENRNGLAVGGCVLPASGHAERAAALELLGARMGEGRVTLEADKGYDTRDFVGAISLLGVTPHVAQNTTHRRVMSNGRPHLGGRRQETTRLDAGLYHIQAAGYRGIGDDEPATGGVVTLLGRSSLEHSVKSIRHLAPAMALAPAADQKSGVEMSPHNT